MTASATPPAARISVTIAVQRVGAAGGEHDGGALGGEEPGRGRADAAAGAGDEHDLAGEQADGCGVGCELVMTPVVRPAARPDPGTGCTRVRRRRAGLDSRHGQAASSGRSSAAGASGCRPEDVGLALGPAAPHTRSAPRGGGGPRAHLHGVLRPAGTGQGAPRPSGDVLAGDRGRAAAHRRRVRPPARPRRHRAEPHADCTGATSARASSRCSSGCRRPPAS